jgi:hypothetical protein
MIAFNFSTSPESSLIALNKEDTSIIRKLFQISFLGANSNVIFDICLQRRNCGIEYIGIKKGGFYWLCSNI